MTDRIALKGAVLIAMLILAASNLSDLICEALGL